MKMKIKEKQIKNTKWESTPRGVKVVMHGHAEWGHA